METTRKFAKLREILAKHAVAGYLQPVHDEYLSEYPPECYQRVKWLAGFSGSAGMLVVLADKAALFVDGRYTLQAANEIDNALITAHNSGDISPGEWLAGEVHDVAIGYDPALFTPPMLARLQAAGAKKKISFVPVPNPVDAIWQDRPTIPASKIYLHEETYAGESSAAKCARLAEILKKDGVDAALISAPESVCWLLNIRGADVECTPLALLRGILHASGMVDLFAEAERLPKLPDHIHVITPDILPEYEKTLQGKKILCDESLTPDAFVQWLHQAGAKIHKGSDPCMLPRACKNKTQLAGMRAAHQRDGVALTKLLHWLDTHPAIETVSEMAIDEKLLGLRRQQAEFTQPSFPTIAGAGEHGAIVHYRANETSNRTLKQGELLLIDSGGQYLDGTTDVTRTIAIGLPGAEQKDRFTRVLKGHIALAMAMFPQGTSGSQLDALARAPLWQVGLDYDHGTGHGVGHYLGVHEGPQRISKRAGDVALQAGMVLSNEPGYYKTGGYGIRIENLVEVVAKEHGFLGFETLTCAPIDLRLVEHDLLTETEAEWLSYYHQWVESSLTPHLTQEEGEWLHKRLRDMS